MNHNVFTGFKEQPGEVGGSGGRGGGEEERKGKEIGFCLFSGSSLTF